MNTRRWRMGFCLGLAVASSLSLAWGCVKRRETIRVMPDGAVHLQTVFEGDAQDVRTGDPLPDESGPWSVTDELKVEENGKETLTRTAILEVEPGRPFPQRYCPDDAEAARWALEMPTMLRIERRGADLYYHFKRVYRRRDWAFIDYYRQEFLQEELKMLEDQEFADLDEHHQQSIARALLDFEAAKALALAQAAGIELEPLLHQEQQLAIHRGIRSVFESIDAQRIVEVLQMDGEEAGETISIEVQQVQEKIESAIGAALSETDPSGRLARIFVTELDQQRLGHSISEDLQDDAWEVYLQLPGRLIGHNGDTIEDGMVKWEFGGNALCDRDQVLMATSVVSADR